MSAASNRLGQVRATPPQGGGLPATRPEHAIRHDAVLNDTRRWLERAVIGLNLCPFAKAVYVKDQVHFRVSQARETESLLQDLISELCALNAADPRIRDTTLLIVPHCLLDFLDFNDFLTQADDALFSLDLTGVLQIASFHPRYQFAGTASDDITNCTNRAPYPTLHLLRESSIDRAVTVFPAAEAIYETNMATLEALGHAGWCALDVGASPESPEMPPNEP